MSVREILFAAAGVASPATPVDPQIGDPYGGGYYFGNIRQDDGVYRIIVSPKSADVASLSWKTSTATDPGALSVYDGLANSNAINDAAHPAAKYCRDLTTGGFTDWYLPSRDEMEMLFRNLKPRGINNAIGAREPRAGTGNNGDNANSVPVGPSYTATNPGITPVVLFKDGAAQAFVFNTYYWTSTQCFLDATASIAQYLGGDGAQSYAGKTVSSLRVRPIRREKITVPTAPTIGTPMEGGYYVGSIWQDDGLYNLILAPNTQQPSARWSITADAIQPPGPNSLYDGLANTNALNTANYPLMQAARARTTGGFTDWYIASFYELEVIARNIKEGTENNIVGTLSANLGGFPRGANPNSEPIGLAYTATDPGQSSNVIFRTGGTQAYPAASMAASNYVNISGVYNFRETLKSGIAQGSQTFAFTRTGAMIRRVKVEL